MIRKVPNIRAWILKRKDVLILRQVCNIGSCLFLRLPLFEVEVTDIIIPNTRCIEQNEYICCINLNEIKIDNLLLNITLNQLELINKTWNEFYE